MFSLNLRDHCENGIEIRIDDEGDLLIKDTKGAVMYIAGRDMHKLANYLIEAQIVRMGKFSVERRAWQEVVQKHSLY